MFTVILEKNILFYLMAAAGVVSIFAKLVSCMTIHRLARAAENMPKSDHRLMKLIRAKFEHACMVSDKVQNVDAFVDKYLFEYKIWGLRMHTWRELEKQMIVVSGLMAAMGFVWSYNLAGMLGNALYYSAGGIAEMIVLYLIYQWGDESHAWNLIHIYIVDFLENVCAHRMSKAYRNSAGDGARDFAESRRTEKAQSMTEETSREQKRMAQGERGTIQRERGTMLGQDRETLRNQIRESLGGKADELIRTAGRDPMCAQPEERPRTSADDGIMETKIPQAMPQRSSSGQTEYTEDPAMAIQIDEARKNIERDAEERKILIREILEEYLA